MRRSLTRRGLILAAPAVILASAFERNLIGIARAEGAEPGSIIIRIAPGVSIDAVAAILQRHGATLGRSLAPAAKLSYEVLCPIDKEPDLIAELLASGLVTSARQSPSAHQAATPSDPAFTNDAWFNAINAPTVWDRFKLSNFSSMPPCINIDAGLAGTWSSPNFTPLHDDLIGQVTQTYNVVTGTGDVTSSNLHGDAVLGIMAAITNNAIAVPSIGWGGTGIMIKALNFADHITAMNWIISNITPPSFIAYPWYFTGSSPNPDLTDAATALYNAGHLLVGCSGDSGTSTCDYGTGNVPNPYAITVTACSAAYARVTSYASYGPAKGGGSGQGATACAPGGNNTGTPLPSDFFDTIKATTPTNYSASAEGTSFSAPVIAGIARFLQTISPGLTIPVIRSIMTDQSLTIATTGFGAFPIGCVDFLAVVQYVQSRMPVSFR